MVVEIRPLQPGDAEEIEVFAVRAWAPVLDPMRAILGNGVFAILRGSDWRRGQASAVRQTIAFTALPVVRCFKAV